MIIIVMPEHNFESYTVSDFSDINCVEIIDISVNVKKGELSRIYTLTLAVKSKENVLDAIRILEMRKDIYSAEPNYLIQPCGIPDDEEYVSGNQWAIDKIDLPDAWDITTGSSTIYVGVLDLGIQANHKDLQNRHNRKVMPIF